jgi:proline iminopeptidase
MVPSSLGGVSYVAVAGASFWTESRGSGIPLVLAHGGPGLSNNLGPVAEMVEDVSRVHRYDQRGCGRSSADGPFEVATSVADLDALREHWGHERWVVGGHSWGAALALFYALEHRDRTLGVIYLSGTSPRWDFPERVRAERVSRLTEAERAEFEAREDEERWVQLMWTTDFARRETADAVLARGPLFEHPVSWPAARAMQADWKARLDAGIEDDLRRLDVPVLVLHGDHDPDPVGAREVAALLPRAEWALLEDAGHSPWLEQPAAMRARLRAFLASLGCTTSA